MVDTTPTLEDVQDALDMEYVDEVEKVRDDRFKVVADEFWQDESDIQNLADIGLVVTTVKSTGARIVKVWLDTFEPVTKEVEVTKTVERNSLDW